MIMLDNVIAGYNGHKVNPVVNGCIKQGSMVAIIGPNGIGKSTLLKTLGGLLPPISGTLKFGKSGRPNIGYLAQTRNIDHRCCPLTVFDVVSMGFWPKISLFTKVNYHQEIIIWHVLKKMKLLDLIHQYIGNLSGGQFQRMLFARILVQQAPLILLDEPFRSVDQNSYKVMIRSIIQLCNKGCTVIVVLHNEKLFFKYFSSILMFTQLCGVWYSRYKQVL